MASRRSPGRDKTSSEAAQAVVVALVVDSLGRGGAERMVVSLANRLDRERYRPIVVTTRRSGELAHDLEPGVRLFELGRTGRLDLRALTHLARFLEAERVEVVHSHNHTTSYLCRLTRILGSGPWAHVVHDHHSPYSWRLAVMDRILLKEVDAYLAVSTAIRRRAIAWVGLSPERCIVVRNGVRLPPRVVRVSHSPVQLVQVARVEPVKNHGFALEVAARLRDRGVDFVWSAVGRCDSRHGRELAAAAGRAGLSGAFVLGGERVDIAEVLSSADIGVLTSEREGMSMSILEYMASGLPIVMTDVGESASLVRRAGGGFIVTQGDIDGAVRALATLIEDEEMRRDFGDRNRRMVEAEFSDVAMANDVMHQYDAVRARLRAEGGD